MNESLTASSIKRFKSNIASYISVGVLCGLFLVLVSLLSFVDVGVFLIGIAIFGFPFIFASYVSCYFLEANQQITIKAFFYYYFGFFRPQFRGSFRGIISFFKSLAVYFGSMVVLYLILFLVYSNYYGDAFIAALSEMVSQYTAGATYEELINMLGQNDGVVLTFMIYVSSFPIPLALTFFFYTTSFNSLSIYYRVNVVSGSSSMLRLGVANTYAHHRRAMRKDWFKLNWLMLVLPIIGAALGALVFFLLIRDALFLLPCLIIGAFIPSIFFLPFYFSNMEVLYHRYENAFKEGNKVAVQTILNHIQTSIELSEEERRSLEDSFKQEEDDNEKKE